jgi:aspartate aminotransferase
MARIAAKVHRLSETFDLNRAGEPTMSRSPAAFLPSPQDAAALRKRSLSPLAHGMEGSKIRAVASEVWALQAQGAEVCNLTIGDFVPAQFPVPKAFMDRMVLEAQAGQTNYTPADGIPELKAAIAAQYARELGIDFGPDSVVVGAGARPLMWATYRAFLTAGDGFAYGVPSWNTNYYDYLFQCRGLVMVGQPEARFLPTAEQVERVLPEARILVLNNPLNPTGTAYQPHELEAVCQALLAENKRRERDGRPPCMMLYDQVYWTLTGAGRQHAHPLGLVPELAPYVVYLDAISKSLAATGLRVGWAVVPPHLATAFKAVIGHMGGFAPRPEQRATAWYLDQPELVAADRAAMNAGVRERLGLLVETIEGFRAEGLPVDLIRPEGGIYLSVRFDLHGRRTAEGEKLENNDDIRRFLLHTAGLAVVPFQAFGLEEDTGWFRISVGAADPAKVVAGLERVRTALKSM